MDVPEFRMERFTIQLQAVEMHLQNPKTGFCSFLSLFFVVVNFLKGVTTPELLWRVVDKR